MESIKESVINSTKWTAFEKLGVQGVQFVLSIVMARLLTPEDYGIVGMLSVFLTISTTFVDSGFSNALVRKQEYKEVDYSTVFFFNFFVAVVVYLILFFTAPLIASFFEMPILTSVLRVQALSLIINSLTVVQVAKLTRALDFKSLALLTMYSNILSGICGIGLAYLGFGVWALVGQVLIQSVINLLYLVIRYRWFPTTGFSIDSFKELGSYGSRLLASSLLHTLYTQLTTFIIGKFFSAKTLGFYNRAVQTVALPKQLFEGVIGKITFPIFAKVQDDKKRLINVYRKYIKMSSMCMFFAYALLFALSKPLVLFLLTDKWADCIIYLQLLCFVCMFDNVTSINLTLLKVIGRSDLYLRLEIIKKIISVSILLCAVPFGVIGICVAKIFYEQLAIAINTYYTGKIFNLGYLTQWKDFYIYLICAIVAVAPAYLLTYLDMPNIVTLIIGAVISTTIYVTILWRNPSMKELRATALQKIHKR